MTCSRLWAPLRWILRDQTRGHQIMHPKPLKDHRVELRCSECLQTWNVAASFEPSLVYEHRQWVAVVKAKAGKLLTFKRRAA